ncbi:signal recognition particle-docking protein FtsY [Oscillatoriales cyanobacterium USR001]|nr:signal recognition particle-docking protein FtsY [Oscillatoriales cyanobacterium USR001]
MVFNWFRRQYSDRPDESTNPPATTAPAESTPETKESTPTETPQPEALAEDYLSWAKAAYKNIQQQQKTEAETAEVPNSTAPEVVEEKIAESVSQVEEAIATEITAPEVIESIAVVAKIEEAIAITEPIAEVVQVEESTAINEPINESEETSPEETNIAEPLPFWARAQAEREARIERLKETAIEETEEVITKAVSTTEELDPEAITDEFPIAFDEGFLWSSEILASQGRRPDRVSFEEISWLQKLRKGLERTRRSLINQLKAIVGQGPLNQDAVTEIESLLLQADVGVEATDIIVNALQQKLREEVLPPEQAIAYLKKLLRDLLDSPCQEKASGNPAYSLTFAPEKDTLNIWLIVGVNGAGKTTTIGKISHLAQKSDYRTLIAAADTFRAAAVEQVKVWGSRSNVEVIANPGKNTDPAAVVFDAIAAAQSRNTELLIVDTAGRLQNKKNLMDELSKIRRIIDKKAPGAIVESLLVLDATLGQNGLRQAEVFSEAAQLSGVVLTKLDGTAKGGVALAVVQQLGLPIRFIGVGESIEDLRPFSSYEFVEALLSG